MPLNDPAMDEHILCPAADGAGRRAAETKKVKENTKESCFRATETAFAILVYIFEAIDSKIQKRVDFFGGGV